VAGARRWVVIRSQWQQRANAGPRIGARFAQAFPDAVQR
jgi:hypothetical protein